MQTTGPYMPSTIAALTGVWMSKLTACKYNDKYIDSQSEFAPQRRLLIQISLLSAVVISVIH
jgi:hypothetical protein